MTTLHDLFPGRYLAGEDLNGQDAVVTIRRVEVEEMGRLDKKGETTQKPVVYFHGLPKGLVLNKTNAVTIARLYGDVIEDWYGKPVALYPKREHAFGSDWTVIRIRPRRPDNAPAVNPATGEVSAALVSETPPPNTPKPAAPASPADLLTLVNARVEAPYDNLPHLLNALRGEYANPRWNWPQPRDLDGWRDAYRLAMDHARRKTAPATPASTVPDYEGEGEVTEASF